jgi:hypothetical protein
VGGWLTPRPGRFNPGEYNQYPLHRRLGGLYGRYGWGTENHAPNGIRSPDRPAQSVAIPTTLSQPSFTDCAQFKTCKDRGTKGHTLQACIPTPNSKNLTSIHFFSFTSTKRHNKEGHKCSSCTRYCCCLQQRNMKAKNVSLGNF